MLTSKLKMSLPKGRCGSRPLRLGKCSDQAGRSFFRTARLRFKLLVRCSHFSEPKIPIVSCQKESGKHSVLTPYHSDSCAF